MRIVFMGTPEFAVPTLNLLIEKHEVLLTITQPDKPKGRGNKLSISPVKEVSLKNNIKVIQCNKIKEDSETINILKELNPDVIVVVAYGQILSKEILSIPKYGCINLHGSLLPKLRGAAPINWAIINGECETGNTTQYMDTGIDTGDILLKSTVKIDESINSQELYDILKEDGAKLVIETLDLIEKNKLIRIPQNNEESSYAPILKKEVGKIDWNKSSQDIYNLMRGLIPWPLTYSTFNGQNVKFHEGIVDKSNKPGKPGEILEVSKKGILVKCGEGAILITKIQFPNKKAMNVEEYIKGNKIIEGETFI